MGAYGSFSNIGLFLGGYDLKGDSNNALITASKEVLDHSVFGCLGKYRGLGIEDAALAASGFLNTALLAQADQMRANWTAGSNVPLSMFIPATSGAAVVPGDLAIFFKSLDPKLVLGGAHGPSLPWNLNAVKSDGYYTAIGKVLAPGITAITGSIDGTAVQVAACPTGKSLYAVLHVTQVSASDSIVVTIQSDEAANFATPFDHLVFASQSAIGSVLTVLAGPLGAGTDTWWRAGATVTGADVSIKYAVAIAIM